MIDLRRSVCLMGLAAALVLSASGCTDYTYFNIHVTTCSDGETQCPAEKLVDSSIQGRIDNCFVVVNDKASGKSIERSTELVAGGKRACNYQLTPADIGTLDYSSAKGGGTLTFVVSMIAVDTSNKTATILDGSVDGPEKGGILSLNLVATPCNDPNGTIPGIPTANRTCVVAGSAP